MIKSINKYIKFIIIFYIFNQLNAMEYKDQKDQQFEIPILPLEIKEKILCHKIENIIYHSVNYSSAIDDVLRFIYNILITSWDLYSLKNNLFKTMKFFLRDQYAPKNNYTLIRVIKLLDKNKKLSKYKKNYIAQAIIYGIDYSLQCSYPSTNILNKIIKKDETQLSNKLSLLKIIRLYNRINLIGNNICNKFIDGTKDPLIYQSSIKYSIEKGLNKNNFNYLDNILNNISVYFNNPNDTYEINYIITSNGVSLLIEAIINNNMYAIKTLLKHSIDINAIYEHYDFPTALHTAIIQNNISIVKFLLEKNADVNIKYIDGKTPLILTALEGYKDIIKLLIVSNADINAVDKDGDTALICTVLKGYENIVKLLIKSDADVNIKDNNGNSALIWATINGYIDIVKLLIDNGADINARDNDGNSALIWATINGRTKIVKLLLDNKADINIINKDSNTALIKAVSNNHKKIVKLLLDSDADIDIQNKKGNNALAIAINKNHEDIIYLFVS